MDPYTRPFASYSRGSPSRTNPDQGPSSYSYNKSIGSYGEKDNRTTTTTAGYNNYPAKYTTEEGKPVRGYSPARGEAIDSTSKPPRSVKENEVLSRANEVLQRSLRFTNAATASKADSNPQAKSYTFTGTGAGTGPGIGTSTITSTGSNQPLSANAKTMDILNRANAILNKSTNSAAHIAERSNLAKTFTSFNRNDFAAKETPQLEEPTPNNTSFGNAPQERQNNPRNILSRVQQALQNSNQISADPNPYGIETRTYTQSIGAPLRSEDKIASEPRRSYGERENRQHTPQKSPYNYRSPPKDATYQQGSRLGSGNKNFKASEYANRNNQELNNAYHDALHRSQELVQRNEEELMRSANKREEMNLKSSYVMERQRGASPNPNEGRDQDMATPGIYIPAQGIRPKFCEEYYEDGTIYKGEKIRTAKHGRGEFLYGDSSKYEGEWENDRKNGYGIQTFPNGTIQYDGEWKDDVYHGHGILVNGDAKEEKDFTYFNFETIENNWIKYEGEFLNGKMHGLGTITLFNNERYVGKFKYDQVHGAGVFHKSNGETVSGEWENSKFVKNL